MTSIEQTRAAVIEALHAAGVTTVDVEGALESKDGGRLIVLVDGAVETMKGLIASTHPMFAALTPVFRDEFSAHLVGSAWIAVSVTTPEAWNAEDDDEEDESDLPAPMPFEPVDPQLWSRVDEAVATLAASIPISDHRTVGKARDLLAEHLSEHGPELADLLRGYPGIRLLQEAAEELQRGLKDAHTTAMHRDARAWAERIYSESPIPAQSRRPVFREAAYRYMNRIDAACATRIATEAIADELEAVADEHTPTITF